MTVRAACVCAVASLVLRVKFDTVISDKDIYSKERILLSSSSESESENEEAVAKEDASDKLNIGFNWDVLKNRELLSAAKPGINEESSSDDVCYNVYMFWNVIYIDCLN